MTARKAAAKDKVPNASVTMKRPPEPVTATELQARLAPLLIRLGDLDWDDVASIHITHGSIRLGLVPRSRGRRQLDSLVRVSYPIVWDEEE